MAQSTPGPSLRMLTRMSSIPMTGERAGHANPIKLGSLKTAGSERGGGGIGGPKTDTEGNLLPPIGRPGTLSGIIGRMMDKSDIAEYNTKNEAANAAKKDAIQSGLDAYGQALQQTGDPKAALRTVFSPDAGGHVHFSDPAVFGSILALHQAQTLGMPPGQFTTTQLPGGLLGVTDPSGKTSVHVPGKGGTIKMADGSTGMLGQDEKGNPVIKPIPMEGGGTQPGKPAPQAKVDEKGEQQTANLTTVLSGMQTLKNNIGATGSMGWGALLRGVDVHTALSGPVGSAYNAAYQEMAPAIMALRRAPGMTTKQNADIIRDVLPEPTKATFFQLAEALPRLEYDMRQRTGNALQYAKAANTANAPALEQLAQTHDAFPQLMHRLDTARQMLQTDPNHMSTDMVNDLYREVQKGRLPLSDKTEVLHQAGQRGFFSASEMGKIWQANPKLQQMPLDLQQQNPQAWKPPRQENGAATGGPSAPIQNPPIVQPPQGPTPTGTVPSPAVTTLPPGTSPPASQPPAQGGTPLMGTAGTEATTVPGMPPGGVMGEPGAPGAGEAPIGNTQQPVPAPAPQSLLEMLNPIKPAGAAEVPTTDQAALIPPSPLMTAQAAPSGSPAAETAPPGKEGTNPIATGMGGSDDKELARQQSNEDLLRETRRLLQATSNTTATAPVNDDTGQ